MHKRLARFLIAGTAVVATTVLGAASASAVPATITVDNPHSDGTYTASSDETVLVDTDTGTSFTCTTDSAGKASTASGIIASGQYGLPHSFDQGVTSLDFHNCTSNFGPVTVDAIGSHGPYNLTVQNYPGADENGDPANGDGYIGNVRAHVSVSFCSFDVSGSADGSVPGQVPAYYLNEGNPSNTSGTGELHLTANPAPDVTLDNPLTASNTSGCFGLVRDGDHLTYEAVYTIDDPTSPSITVTSP